MEISLNHIAVVSRDKQKTVKFFELLGSHIKSSEVVASERVETTFLPLGDSRPNIEIIEETEESEDHPVYRYRKKFGSGFHHIALNVTKIEVLAKSLLDQGINLVNETPKAGAHNSQIIFVHPKSTGGILVELVEK